MSLEAQPFYPPSVEKRDLDRLELQWPDLDAAMDYLEAANLLVEESRLEPGGLVGGRRRTGTNRVPVYQRGFLISPRGQRFVASVVGPGNLSRQQIVETPLEAARWVVEEYARQSDPDGADR